MFQIAECGGDLGVIIVVVKMVQGEEEQFVLMGEA